MKKLIKLLKYHPLVLTLIFLLVYHRYLMIKEKPKFIFLEVGLVGKIYITRKNVITLKV